jgi:nucleoside-diphosphate-sugar epimerase
LWPATAAGAAAPGIRHRLGRDPLAAAKVGGIEANRSYSADFLLENLKIQTQVIEAAWRSGVHRLLFLGSSCIYPRYADQRHQAPPGAAAAARL